MPAHTKEGIEMKRYTILPPSGPVVTESTLHKALLELSRHIYISPRDQERLKMQALQGHKELNAAYGFAHGQILISGD